MIYENINVFWNHYKGHGNGNEMKRNEMERIKYKVATYIQLDSPFFLFVLEN